MEKSTKAIISSIPSALFTLKVIEDGFFIAVLIFIVFFGIIYFLISVWEMITYDESKEPKMDQETQDLITISEWYDNDMNFNYNKKKPVSVALAEARTGTKGKFRGDE